MPTKDDLIAQAEAEGIEVDDSMTKAEIEALLEGEKMVSDSERICPNCGELHGSSIVPESEVGTLEGVKVSTLPASKAYRVFYCDAVFHVVPSKEAA